MPPRAAKSLALSPSSVLFRSLVRTLPALAYHAARFTGAPSFANLPTDLSAVATAEADRPQLTSFPPITSALSIRRRMRILSEHRESKDPIPKRSLATALLAQQTSLTLVLPITSALFASFNAHKQPIKPFLFFHFRTLVIKRGDGTYDSSPNFCFALRNTPRPLPLLRALCVNPTSALPSEPSAVSCQPLASSIFLPAPILQPSPRRSSGEGAPLASKPFRICTEHPEKACGERSRTDANPACPEPGRGERAQGVEGSRPEVPYAPRTHGNFIRNPFRINTSKSVTKQRTLNTFRINTYAKLGGGGHELGRRSYPPKTPATPEFTYFPAKPFVQQWFTMANPNFMGPKVASMFHLRSCGFPLCIVVLLAVPASLQAQSSIHSSLSASSVAASPDPLLQAAAGLKRAERAMFLYERIERTETRKQAADPQPSKVDIDRVIPAGTGLDYIPLGPNGKPKDPAAYLAAMEKLLKSLEWATKDGHDQQVAYAKVQKRIKQRDDMIDALQSAFIFTFLGRETQNGRTLLKYHMVPNPTFKPTSRNTAMFCKIRGDVWLDAASSQLVRVEGRVTQDISFGIFLAKIYKGSHFAQDRREVAPGLWLPTYTEVDFDGRKFFSSFSIHEKTFDSGYRLLGPPAKALPEIRAEVARLKSGGSGALSSSASNQ
jgi:hypothetical protein